MREYTKDNPLLMIPGPVESAENVLNSTSSRMYSHTEKSFVDSFQNALLQMRSVFEADNSYSPVVIAGGGTLAMEIAMINLIDQSKDQKALVLESGYFGSRYSTIANTFNLETISVKSEIGSKITEDQIRSSIEGTEIDFAFIQHVDTSTGVANDIEMFGRICKEFDIISVVDGVCALGGQPLYQTKWDIDIYFTGAQKALALPPGLAIMMYSQKARELSENRKKPLPSYYANLENWWSVMDAYISGSASYFSTPATNLITGLERATKNLLEEGMENVFSRHERLSNKFRNELSDLGFEFITKEDSRALTMSTPKYLDSDNAGQFRQSMLSEGVQIAGGIQGGIANTYFRVGHMGTISEEQIDFTLSAIKNSI